MCVCVCVCMYVCVPLWATISSCCAASWAFEAASSTFIATFSASKREIWASCSETCAFLAIFPALARPVLLIAERLCAGTTLPDIEEGKLIDGEYGQINFFKKRSKQRMLRFYNIFEQETI